MSALTWDIPLVSGPVTRPESRRRPERSGVARSATVARATAVARVSSVRKPAPVASTVARPGLRLTPRGRVVLAVLALLVAAAWMLGGTAAAAGSAPAAVPVTAVTVTSGETLWQIASSVTEPGRDVRDTIDLLVQMNGLDGVGLRVGQQLLVPQVGIAS